MRSEPSVAERAKQSSLSRLAYLLLAVAKESVAVMHLIYGKNLPIVITYVVHKTIPPVRTRGIVKLILFHCYQFGLLIWASRVYPNEGFIPVCGINFTVLWIGSKSDVRFCCYWRISKYIFHQREELFFRYSLIMTAPRSKFKLVRCNWVVLNECRNYILLDG